MRMGLDAFISRTIIDWYCFIFFCLKYLSPNITTTFRYHAITFSLLSLIYNLHNMSNTDCSNFTDLELSFFKCIVLLYLKYYITNLKSFGLDSHQNCYHQNCYHHNSRHTYQVRKLSLDSFSIPDSSKSLLQNRRLWFPHNRFLERRLLVEICSSTISMSHESIRPSHITTSLLLKTRVFLKKLVGARFHACAYKQPIEKMGRATTARVHYQQKLIASSSIFRRS